MTRKRPLTPSELDLWRRVTADVQPLDGKPMDDLAAPRPTKAKSVGNGRRREVIRPTPTLKTQASPANARPLDPTGPIDIDRRSWERLKRGQVTIERKLDLHGKTQTEAHGALNRFLTMAATTGLRCVLVVTGKGGGESRGVLRQMVPRWLTEASNRQTVLTFCPAQPRHGGDGALYVLLRRNRKGGRHG